MADMSTVVFACAAGGALGTLFFGGLWWTVRAGVASPHPARWFLASLLVRMTITLGGFYLVSGGKWDRLLPCLVGFIVARIAVIRWTRTRDVAGVPASPVHHAP